MMYCINEQTFRRSSVTIELTFASLTSAVSGLFKKLLLLSQNNLLKLVKL